jgi:hypothetical protein
MTPVKGGRHDRPASFDIDLVREHGDAKRVASRFWDCDE